MVVLAARAWGEHGQIEWPQGSVELHIRGNVILCTWRDGKHWAARADVARLLKIPLEGEPYVEVAPLLAEKGCQLKLRSDGSVEATPPPARAYEPPPPPPEVQAAAREAAARRDAERAARSSLPPDDIVKGFLNALIRGDLLDWDSYLTGDLRYKVWDWSKGVIRGFEVRSVVGDMVSATIIFESRAHTDLPETHTFTVRGGKIIDIR